MLKLLRQVTERLNIPPESIDEARATKHSEETNVYELVQTIQHEMPHDK